LLAKEASPEGATGLRILFVSAFQDGPNSVWHLAKEMARLGHEVELAVPAEGTLSTRATAAGIPVHVVAIRSSLRTDSLLAKRWIDLRGVAELRNLLVDGRYQVVHLNLLRARVIGRLASVLAGNRNAVVSTIRGLDLENPAYLLMERVTNGVDRLTVAVSEDTRNYLVTKGISAAKIRIIPNGLDLDSTDRTPVKQDALARELGTWSPVVGLVAYLYPHVKGHEVFLRAAQRVLIEFPETHFAVVGGTLSPRDDFYRNRLGELAARLGITEAVSFLGHRADVLNLIDSMDVLVLPSVVREGFGMVLIEAMARRKPVIASRIGGIPDIIEDNLNGLLVTPGDHVGLAEAIARLLGDRDLRARLGNAGRRRVEEKFSIASVARQYEVVFSDAAASIRGCRTFGGGAGVTP